MDDRYGASLYEIEIGIVVPAVIYVPVWLADQRGVPVVGAVDAWLSRGRA